MKLSPRTNVIFVTNLESTVTSAILKGCQGIATVKPHQDVVMKQLAPFGEYLAKQIDKEGALGVAIIFMGQFAFERALGFQDILPYTLALPPNSSPARFDWPVKSCYVYLCDTGYADYSFVRFCALTLFGYGATEVRYISRNKIFTIEKGVSHGRQ